MKPTLSFLLLLSSGLTAQDCVPGACTEALVNDSQNVVILNIGQNDLHFSNKTELIGDTLMVKNGLLLNKDKTCEYNGTLRDAQQKLLFFSHLQVKVLTQQTKTMAGECRENAMNNADLMEGSEVTILAIHASDIYSLIDPGLVGKKMNVKTQLKNFKDCWYEGTLEDEQKNSYVFTKIQVSSENGIIGRPFPRAMNPVITMKDGRYTKDPIPKAFPVKILEIASTDIMFEKKSLLLNQIAKTTEELKHVGDDWYMGNLQTKDGGQYYFFKVRLGPVGQ